MSKSINKLALAGALTLALSGAFAGFAEARGGGGGGGGGGGPEASITNAVVLPDVPRRRRPAPETHAGPEGCHYHSYWGTTCDMRGGRR